MQHFALKILNPVGYKLERKSTLKQCKVAVKGELRRRIRSSSSSTDEKSSAYEPLAARHIWWLVHTHTGQIVSAYHDVERGDLLREMTLPRCVSVWGLDALADENESSSDNRQQGVRGNNDDMPNNMSPSAASRVVTCDGRPVQIPALPPKYERFLRTRRRMYREIFHMRKLSMHPHVLLLDSVLEMIHDSKTTVFLVLELAKGGELFDRIALDEGASEDTAKRYFIQLLDGVGHCHDQGVCHRDLKPENLLLADEDGETLKIADFGLSAITQQSENFESSSLPVLASNNDNISDSGSSGGGGGFAHSPPSSSIISPSVASPPCSPGLRNGQNGSSGVVLGSPRSPSVPQMQQVALKRQLKSVVGSPFYVAPEILDEDSEGYDGTKADMWSIGVILYAMLAGNLPFGKDLHNCLRFRKFKNWLEQQRRQHAAAAAEGTRVATGSAEAARNNGCFNDLEDDDKFDENIGPESVHFECDVSTAPPWLFPPKASLEAQSLLCLLLTPDPRERLSVRQAQNHPWVCRYRESKEALPSGLDDDEIIDDVATHSSLDDDDNAVEGLAIGTMAVSEEAGASSSPPGVRSVTNDSDAAATESENSIIPKVSATLESVHTGTPVASRSLERMGNAAVPYSPKVDDDATMPMSTAHAPSGLAMMLHGSPFQSRPSSQAALQQQQQQHTPEVGSPYASSTTPTSGLAQMLKAASSASDSSDRQSQSVGATDKQQPRSPHRRRSGENMFASPPLITASDVLHSSVVTGGLKETEGSRGTTSSSNSSNTPHSFARSFSRKRRKSFPPSSGFQFSSETSPSRRVMLASQFRGICSGRIDGYTPRGGILPLAVPTPTATGEVAAPTESVGRRSSPYDASLSSFPPAPIDKCRIGRFHGLLKGSIEYGQGVDGEGETTASEFGRGFGTGSIIYPLGAFGDSAIGHSLLMQQAGMPSSLPSRFTSSWGSSSSVATGGVHYAPDASEIPSTRGFSQQLQSLDSHEVRALALNAPQITGSSALFGGLEPASAVSHTGSSFLAAQMERRHEQNLISSHRSDSHPNPQYNMDEKIGKDGTSPEATGPAEFQDLVKRSTRFVTAVPASEVLYGIEEIIGSDSVQMPPP